MPHDQAIKISATNPPGLRRVPALARTLDRAAHVKNAPVPEMKFKPKIRLEAVSNQ